MNSTFRRIRAAFEAERLLHQIAGRCGWDRREPGWAARGVQQLFAELDQHSRSAWAVIRCGCGSWSEVLTGPGGISIPLGWTLAQVGPSDVRVQCPRCKSAQGSTLRSVGRAAELLRAALAVEGACTSAQRLALRDVLDELEGWKP